MHEPITSSAGAPELVSVVVPTRREVENIPSLLRRLDAAMRQAGRPYEAILVDDDSRDGTDLAVERLAAEGIPARLVVRVGERGLSSAALRGFHQARGDILVCMDADLSHPPEAIPLLLEAIGKGADFVLGSRYVAGASREARWGFLRWLNSKAAALLARPLTPVKDPMSGFFALRRSVFERAAPLRPIGYKIALELLVKCRRPQVREVPIHFASRLRGKTKLNLYQQWLYLRHLVRLAGYRLGAGSGDG